MLHLYKDERGAFQNYVYTIVDMDSNWTLGCKPNFKKAYERLEELAGNGIIIDCGFDENGNWSASFEVIHTRECAYGKYFVTRRYKINRDLLTIFDNDILIPVDLIEQIQSENKKKAKTNYKLKTEII